jgi:hypothetical protein
MARQVVRGTPIRSYAAGDQGRSAGTPKGMQGTQPQQFTSDKRGYQSQAGEGTPYTSRDGNGATSRRVVEAGMTKGLIPDSQGVVNNDPMSTGSGVILDGANGIDHSPHGAPAMDSPVPGHAPRFNPADMIAENRSHLGSGNEAGMVDLVNSPGVMGRGMDTVSQAGNKDVSELTRDDTLTGKITKSDI